MCNNISLSNEVCDYANILQRRTCMGLKLKIKRVESGLKQKDVAQLIGVSQQYLGNLESGRSKNPSREIMLKLAAIYNCSVQDLFFSEEN